MFDIQKLIKKALKKYADEIISRMIQYKSNEQVLQLYCSFTINTAEHCKDTIPALQD